MALMTIAVAGCGGDDEDDSPLSRTQVEERAAREAPNAGSGAKASCVERDEDRTYRCEITEGSETSYFTVFVSKDGKRIQFEQL